MTFYLLLMLGIGCFLGLAESIYQSISYNPQNERELAVEKLFYNTPEQNQEIEKINRFSGFFQSLLKDVVFVLIAYLCYELCLYYQVF